MGRAVHHATTGTAGIESVGQDQGAAAEPGQDDGTRGGLDGGAAGQLGRAARGEVGPSGQLAGG